MKRLSLVYKTALLGLLIITASASVRRVEFKVSTIVIDAGHGGHDTGTLGKTCKEKEVALNIALELGKLIASKLPKVKVIYTRKSDQYVPLDERADIANKSKADLFVCIHANSMPGAKAYGTETYVMGTNASKNNFEVAKRENSVILLDKDYNERYEEFDPNNPESYILFSLSQSAYHESSLNFAQKVEDQLEKQAGRHSRGVKQAGFWVLWRTTMPSALIETGFLSHSKEEIYLKSPEGQAAIANGIFSAIAEYKQEVESLNN